MTERESQLAAAKPDSHIEESGQTIDSIDAIDDAQAMASMPRADEASINDRRRHIATHIHYR
jgi:hypothetical protein